MRSICVPNFQITAYIRSIRCCQVGLNAIRRIILKLLYAQIVQGGFYIVDEITLFHICKTEWLIGMHE